MLAGNAVVAVISTVRGRHEHLRRQREGLRRSSRPVDLHVIVAMDDPDLQATVTDDAPPAVVLPFPPPGLPVTDDRLPLAAARNLGARWARSAGADVLIFLDVDCIPGPALVEQYVASAADGRAALLSGPVAYLPPAPPAGYDLDTLADLAADHPGRPAAEPGTLTVADHRLFWSLSFAVHFRTWQRIGGFCELYTGYGAEDTDFAQLARRDGVPHLWVADARAYHQHHASENPPVEHLHDIIRNATLFHERWNWWPMQGWLTEFEQRGLARHDLLRDVWAATERAATT